MFPYHLIPHQLEEISDAIQVHLGNYCKVPLY